MKRILPLLMVAACGGTQHPADQKKPVDDDQIQIQPKQPSGALTARMLGRLHDAAGCPGKGWCLAADGWDSAQAGEIAPGPHVLAGMTVPLVPDVDASKLLAKEVTFSTLVLSDGKGVITEVPAKSDMAKLMVADAKANAERFFAGQAPTLKLAPKLHAFLKELPASADHDVTKTGNEWTLAGEGSKAEIRKSGDVWIVVETPSEGPEGVYVSLFTDQLSDE